MTTTTSTRADPTPVFCARCSTQLCPGSGGCYRVTIEAVADPAPQVLSEQEAVDIRQQIEKLLARLQDVSEREALDEVHRRLVLYLCTPCYRNWIEDPV